MNDPDGESNKIYFNTNINWASEKRIYALVEFFVMVQQNMAFFSLSMGTT